jgi:hypothetical protein
MLSDTFSKLTKGKHTMETKSFDVEGIGKFEFIPELPHTVFFMDRRKRMASLVGGIRNLLTLETMMNDGLEVDEVTKMYKPRESADDMTQKLGWASLLEYNRASSMVEMQDHITKFPQGKTLERLSPQEYGKVEEEFNKQLDSFRNPEPKKAEPATPPTQPQG